MIFHYCQGYKPRCSSQATPTPTSPTLTSALTNQMAPSHAHHKWLLHIHRLNNVRSSLSTIQPSLHTSPNRSYLASLFIATQDHHHATRSLRHANRMQPPCLRPDPLIHSNTHHISAPTATRSQSPPTAHTTVVRAHLMSKTLQKNWSTMARTLSFN